MVRAKGARRTILVTDAIAAAGCAPGRYRIGAVDCDLGEDGRVSLPGTPYLAGSSLTMDRAIANTVAVHRAAARGGGADGLDECRARCLGLTTAGTLIADWDGEGLCTLHVRGVTP